MEKTWPSREEWAKQHRSTAGCENPTLAKRQASLYATAEEIAAMVAALKQSYNVHGRNLRRAKAACPDLVARMKAKTTIGRVRWSDEDRARYRPVRNAEDARQTIDAALKWLAKDSVPQDGRHLPEIAKLVLRYEGACEAADAAWRAEVATRPIDDEAWAKELERRQEVEQYLESRRRNAAAS